MKTILVISIALCSIAAVAERVGEDRIVIVDDYTSASTLIYSSPDFSGDIYIAEPTGEVIKDFVPAKVQATREGVKRDVFHPPKARR